MAIKTYKGLFKALNKNIDIAVENTANILLEKLKEYINEDYYNLYEQIRRLKLFADAYDLKNNEREQLPNMIIQRINSLVAYMRNEADSGNEDVRKNIEDGHLNLYLDDIQYIKESQKNILEGIL